jgi:hypothetical protein
MDEREATAEVATTAADAGGPQQQPEKPAAVAPDQPLAAATEATATAMATGAAAAARQRTKGATPPMRDN